MKNKLIAILMMLPIFAFSGINANAKTLEQERIDLMKSGLDTADPMYMLRTGDILSETEFDIYDSKFGLSQKLSYGFSNRFSLGLDLMYQEDFNGYADGFSNIGLSGIYRLSENSNGMIYDFLFSARFFGSDKLDNPEMSETTYTAGLKVGYEMSFMTLATTFESAWIFDSVDGLSILKVSPEAYFRISEYWTTGLEFDLHQSTNYKYDETALSWKLGTRYGRTQYFGKLGYSFEDSDFLIGAKINILF